MTTKKRHRTPTDPARRRGEMHRANGDRRAGPIIKARHDLATLRVGGPGWLNGREVGRGTDSRSPSPTSRNRMT